MTARILIVDDIPGNIRLLKAKLSAEYFEVVEAMNGLDALDAAGKVKPDIILLDVMMPGIDGIEVCKRLKSNAATKHIPIIMVTALDQLEDRVLGLQAGADDFLTKPINDEALIMRIKNLVRLKRLSDGLRVLATFNDSERFHLDRPASVESRPGNVLVVDSRSAFVDRIRVALAGRHHVVSLKAPLAPDTFVSNDPAGFELIIVNLDPEQFDGLRVCSQLKSLEQTRQIPVLVVVAAGDEHLLVRALDIGVDDYLIRPIDREELLARVNTQIRNSRYLEELLIRAKWRIPHDPPTEPNSKSKLGDGFSSEKFDQKNEDLILSELASPLPFIATDGKIDAGPNPIFDATEDVTNLNDIPIIQMGVIAVIIPSLPAQAPKTLAESLDAYRSELEKRGTRPVLDLLKCLSDIIRADVYAPSAEDEWLSDGLRRGFQLFAENHEKFVKFFPLSPQREAVLSEIRVDEDAAVGSNLSKPMEELAKSVVNANASDTFTENFVKIVEAMTKNAQSLASRPTVHPASMDPILRPVSAKKRFILSTIGFAERTYHLVGTSAGLAGFAASPLGQAFILRLMDLIGAFSRFIL